MKLAATVVLTYIACVLVIGTTIATRGRRVKPLVPSQHVLFDGEVTDALVAQVEAELALAEAQHYPFVVIEFRSRGGYLAPGYHLADVIEKLNTPTVCVVTSQAMSMAFYLLQSCTLRLMTPTATLMVHEPWASKGHVGAAERVAGRVEGPAGRRQQDAGP